jgi:hypothetical protein
VSWTCKVANQSLSSLRLGLLARHRKRHARAAKELLAIKALGRVEPVLIEASATLAGLVFVSAVLSLFTMIFSGELLTSQCPRLSVSIRGHLVFRPSFALFLAKQ